MIRALALPTLIALTMSACGQKTPWDKKQSSDQNAETANTPPSSTTAPIPTGDAGADGLGDVNHSTLENLPQIIQSINATRWHEAGANCANKTIAIFDNGFDGLTESKGVRLPPNLVVEKAPANTQSASPHGTKLAEVIWALCTGSRAYSAARPGPTLKLYNTNGYTNLAAAVEAVSASQNIDMVLYSQVWEFGGNFDGQGFINALVKKVTSRGILWINAAGNYGQTTWQGPLSFDDKSQVKLPYQDRYVRILVNSPKTAIKITLAWNDFTDVKTDRTHKDLDLVLEDMQHKEIASGKLIQDGIDHGKDGAYSAYAREQITSTLDAGIYLVRVTSPDPKNFNILSRLRLAADGRDISFIDQTPEASVMIPADNADVLTIGASDVDFSSAGRILGTTRHKPEALAPSALHFDNGVTFAGSSTAAAVAAAAVALYEGQCGKQGRAGWQNLLQIGAMGAQDKDKAAPTLTLPGSGRCFR